MSTNYIYPTQTFKVSIDLDVQVLKESKYKCDIYKVVQSLEYVERGV